MVTSAQLEAARVSVFVSIHLRMILNPTDFVRTDSFLQETINNYHELRRNEIGTLLISFFGVCKLYQSHRNIYLPPDLHDVIIESEQVDNRLLLKIQGWESLAQFLLDEDSISESLSHESIGSYLMHSLYKFGIVQHILSAGFDSNNNVVNAAYRDPSSTIIVFHDNVIDLDDDDAIRNHPVSRSLSNRNAEYRSRNIIGWFVGRGSTTKLSINKAKKKLGGNNVATSALLNELKRQFIQQGATVPVRATIRRQSVVCGI